MAYETNSIDTNARQRIREFLARFCPAGRLTDDLDVFASGFVNSMIAMQLVMFVEREFGFTLADEDLELKNFRTVDAIVALVARRTAV
jgi:acyl carrier protein